MKRLILFAVACLMAASAFDAAEAARPRSLRGRHELTLSLSDGVIATHNPFDFHNGWSKGYSLHDGTLITAWMPGVGYRYYLTSRLGVGLDFGTNGYSRHVEKAVFEEGQQRPSEWLSRTRYCRQYLVLPTVTLVYLQTRRVRLYGNAGMGFMVADNRFTGQYYQPYMLVTPAFQFTPIGLRVGGRHVGGFLELGLGFRQLVGMGLSVVI